MKTLPTTKPPPITNNLPTPKTNKSSAQRLTWGWRAPVKTNLALPSRPSFRARLRGDLLSYDLKLYNRPSFCLSLFVTGRFILNTRSNLLSCSDPTESRCHRPGVTTRPLYDNDQRVRNVMTSPTDISDHPRPALLDHSSASSVLAFSLVRPLCMGCMSEFTNGLGLATCPPGPLIAQ
jgi:hypothetical protein